MERKVVVEMKGKPTDPPTLTWTYVVGAEDPEDRKRMVEAAIFALQTCTPQEELTELEREKEVGPIRLNVGAELRVRNNDKDRLELVSISLLPREEVEKYWGE